MAGAEEAAPACRVGRKQVVGLIALAIGAKWRVTDPQVMRRFLSHAGKAFLILPVPWAFSPAPSATLCRLLHTECSRCHRRANTARMLGQEKQCPQASVPVRQRLSAIVMAVRM